ncbi:cupin domain-containing protein [Streptomyces fulvorobeus]|uniref:Putative cupin superfamily sugar epimerase n=1 Tax=Streptomyces fulvorobeus TaxID=284028 RepID=A0A7Y9HH69_9ACTN|nr:cupin domain-containing protein [Streptomyces fulvorobeus]NYE44495.1 putative cupin superfamily sugar epimerase [Streptomyces fulvorobeus]
MLVATDGTFDGVGRQTAEPGGDEPVLVSCVVAPGFDFADLKML